MSKPTNDQIHNLLTKYKNIAVIGLSAKPERPSHSVAKFMQTHGYTIIPVTPTYDEILGKTAYPSLLDVPADPPVEIVDIFRQPHYVPEIVEQAIEIGAKVIWMQLGIVNREAAAKATAHGLEVVMNKCIKVEYRLRFMG
jgi:uncharacterized protein